MGNLNGHDRKGSEGGNIPIFGARNAFLPLTSLEDLIRWQWHGP